MTYLAVTDQIDFLVLFYDEFFFIKRGEIRLFDSLGFLGLYAIYILVVIIGRLIHQRMRQNGAAMDSEPILDDTSINSNRDNNDLTNGEDSMHYVSWVVPRSNSNSINGADNADGAQESDTSESKSFWNKINPFEEWNEKSKWGKTWLIVKSPVVLVLTLTIPVVNEEEPNSGYCQKLHAMQIAVSGLMLCFFSKQYDSTTVLTFQFWQFMLLASLLGCILMLLTSDPVKPSRFQPILAFVGFIMAVGWIYSIANEIVSLLKALGIYLNISDAILGLTVLGKNLI